MEGAKEESSETKRKVRTLLSEKLGLDNVNDIIFDTVHRLGSKKSDGKNPPIIMKLISRDDRIAVYEKAKEVLKNDPIINISQDFSNKTRQRRKSLIPLMK